MVNEEIAVYQEQDGAKRVVLAINGEEVSWCWIVPLVIRIGVATVRMDGIGGVETKPEHRLKGYSRRVLTRSMEEMRAGDAGISMLYGISNYYHRFEYVTAGPEYGVFLHGADVDAPLPGGWTVREFTPQDLPAVQRIYDEATALATGTAVRTEQCRVWQKLLEVPGNYPQDECWVAVAPSGQVEGYAWRARWCWSVREILEREFPQTLSFGEVIALTPASADALLAWCRRRAGEEGKEEVLLMVPPDSTVGIAARYTDCRMVQMFSSNGGSMVRLLEARRLLCALAPELTRQIRLASWTEPCLLTLSTELGAGTLEITPDSVRVLGEGDSAAGLPHYTVQISGRVLARLAVGFAPAGDLCARAGIEMPQKVASLLETLFPVRYQHMYLPDRY